MQIFSLFGEILLNDNDIDQRLDSIDQRAEGLGKKIGDVATKFTAAGGAMALAIGGLAVKGSDELQKSLNGLQASTGVADSAMKSMRDSMLSIYNNNFGDSFEDIGKSMAEIGKQTGASGKELEGMTTNALMLRDTFDMDVGESIRSVDMLMKQFGITGDEAFNLLAQGSQNGLDKNGNLLDSINEYSVHFKQLGFDSGEMFNMMANGAKSGVFDIDKLGDAMKEFGIRSKDGSTTSAAGFQALGLDAEKMTSAFSQGGDTAKEAFAKTAEALFALEDPVAKEAAGVALFGTQWEDIGVKGVEALSKAQGEISKTTDALGKINSVKYDSFGEAITGIKRNLETGILMPIGDKVLPKLNEFATWFATNMPEIQQKVSDILPIIMSVLATMLAFKGVSLIIDGVRTAQQLWKDAIVVWSAVTKTATAIQLAMNAAWLANPIGIVIALVAALVAGIIILFNNNKAFHDFIVNSWTTIKQVVGSAITSVIGFIQGLGASISQTWNNIKVSTETMWNNLKTYIMNLWESILTWFITLPTRLQQYAIDMFYAMRDGVEQAVPTVKNAVVNGLEKSWDYIRELPSKAIEWGKDVIQGLINGIDNKISALKDKVTEVTSAITNKVKGLLGIQSPSTVMKEVGGYVVDGLTLGIQNKTPDVGAKMEAIATTIASKGASFISAATSIGQQFSEALQSNIKEPSYSSGSSGGGSSSGGSSGTSITNVKGVGNVVETNGQITVNTKSGSYNEATGQYSITNYKTGQTLYRNGSKEEYESNYEKFHEGGWVGEKPNNLQFGEIPAILQDGEYVLSRKMIEDITGTNTSSPKSNNIQCLNPNLPPMVINNSISFNVNGKEGLTRQEMDKIADYTFKQIGNGMKRMGYK